MTERIRVRVQAGGHEIEIEATPTDIDASLGLLDQLLAKLPRAEEQGLIEPVAPTVAVPIAGSGSDLPPSATASKLPDALMQLLNSGWGSTPRTLREISEALELSAKHYALPTISTALARLTKAGNVRRLKKGDVYSYVSAKR